MKTIAELKEHRIFMNGFHVGMVFGIFFLSLHLFGFFIVGGFELAEAVLINTPENNWTQMGPLKHWATEPQSFE